MHDMPTAAASTTSVEIANFAFSPAVITVKIGATVTWTNKDEDAHTVAITGTAVSKPLQGGDSYAHTFGQPGTYTYRCTIHPNMRGMVVVTST
jgi:plastocyanin